MYPWRIKVSSGRFIMENQHRALLLNPHSQAGATLGHFHIGVFPGGLIPYHAVTAAKPEQQDLLLLLANTAYPSPVDAAARLRLQGVKFIEGFAAHLSECWPAAGWRYLPARCSPPAR
jgi:hypothetical protein